MFFRLCCLCVGGIKHNLYSVFRLETGSFQNHWFVKKKGCFCDYARIIFASPTRSNVFPSSDSVYVEVGIYLIGAIATM